MKEVWSYHLFTLGSQSITLGKVTTLIISIGILLAIYRSILKKYFPKVFESAEIDPKEKKYLTSLLRGLILLFFALAAVITFSQNYILYKFESFDLSILLILKALLFIQFIRLIDWFVSNVIIHSYYATQNNIKSEDESDVLNHETTGKSLVRSIFYLIVLILALNNFHIDFTLYTRQFGEKIVQFKLSNIIYAVLLIFLARLVVWAIINLFFFNIYTKQKINIGSQFAVNQLVKYVVYLIAIIMALNVLGIDMSLVLGGAAALLVGIGLGLQQTFNDVISGLVILFERSVSVGDVLEFDSTVGIVKRIGIRASTIETRGNTSIVVPNHMLVNEKVINWNHFSDKVRFKIDIGVAYGSDTELVKKLLLESVLSNPYVEKFPASFVRFQNFGDFALEFSLYFFSRNLLVIEDVKSDIRLEIDKLFRQNSISIPFPQSEIHIRRD